MQNPILITPKKTLIGQAVSLDKVYSGFSARLAFLCLWLVGAASIIYIVLAELGQFTSSGTVESGAAGYFGFACLGLGLFVSYLPLRFFYLFKLKYPQAMSLSEAESWIAKGESINLYTLFSFELARSTEKIFSAKTLPPLHVLAAAVLESKDIDFIVIRLGVNKQLVLDYLKNEDVSGNVADLMLLALKMASAEGHHQIEVGDVFIAFCQLDPFFAKLLSNLGLDVADIAHVVYWQTSIVRRFLRGKRFLDPQRFLFSGGIGRDWAYGYTPFLQQFGRDMTEFARNAASNLQIVGHEAEIKQIEEALLRQNGGNVVLVGEPGIGKRAVVLGLAKNIIEGKVDDQLEPLHIIELSSETLLSGAKGAGEITERFSRLFAEVANAGNMVLFIENIHTLLSGEGIGSVNASELLLPFLDSAAIHVISTTDIANYNQYIRPSTALSQRLIRISIEEPSAPETIRILEDVVPVVEAKTGSIVSYEALKEVVHAADKYVVDVPNPEKSIDLLDGATAHATSERGRTIVLPKDILAFASMKYEVPAGEAEGNEKNVLLSLESTMHERVIGQEEAIKAISGALRRARAGVTDSKKPIGSFLFLGPTGVGKTETAKALAAAYFGKEEAMIRFDMSEYQNKEDIYRFIGSNVEGRPVQGVLTTAVREHPFSLLLFDEIEKAYRDILDLFLQILDEGHLTDGFGRKVLFSNTIVICTSNAGANLIRESIGNGVAYEQTKKALLDYLQNENIYRPEFLNRFTQVIAFSSLSQQDIEEVATLMINKLRKTVAANRGVSVEVTAEAISLLSRLGFDPQMGARPMQRVLQEKIENFLAEKILSGELKKGDSIKIGPEQIEK